jgi:hypothetical protein
LTSCDISNHGVSQTVKQNATIHVKTTSICEDKLPLSGSVQLYENSFVTMQTFPQG